MIRKKHRYEYLCVTFLANMNEKKQPSYTFIKTVCSHFQIISKMSVRNIKSTTWFDRLPTEIIFIIFNYLSSNDIIYTFFCLSQRLNNVLLQNPHYFNHFELPTTDLNTWEKILSVIGSEIHSLSINTLYLSLPLTYFSNLKSISISSPYRLSNKEMKLILKSNQFKHLHSFRVKQIQLLCGTSSDIYSTHEDYMFNKVFSTENSLEIFQYSLIIPSLADMNTNSFQTNFNLHSLTLTLLRFRDIFSIMEYTPNLKNLNLHSDPPYANEVQTNKSDIKLKELYLKLGGVEMHGTRYRSNLYDQLINAIEKFSSSLICLSLDLVDLYTYTDKEFPFNSLKLQQLIESMNQLKEFHLYAKLDCCSFDRDEILSRFQDQFWFDHNYSFGMHDKYFYTLPFHFDYLYEFYHGFNDVKSSNDDILINNLRLWYNVKSIDLPAISKYDFSFVKELKLKMPNLSFINLKPFYPDDMNKTEDKREKMNITFDKVTTFQCMDGSLETGKVWLINLLPNLTHLILSFAELPPIESQLVKTLNKRVQRLDIDALSGHKDALSGYTKLTEANIVYFSNVQCINIYWNVNVIYERPEESADIVMKIMKNFHNLQTLLIYIKPKNRYNPNQDMEVLSRITDHLDMKNILKNYQMKNFPDHLLFLKW
jgi:hypothetical protein